LPILHRFADETTAMRYKEILYEIIFEADTRAGKIFDLVLMILIIASVISVSLESVASIRSEYGIAISVFEWAITLLFSIEYILRIISVRHPMLYIKSFYGIIDLLSILPFYISLILPTSTGIMVIRVLRLVRLFRVLKLTRYVAEQQTLLESLRRSFARIAVFLSFVVVLVLILSSIMYIIEPAESGFTSIPQSLYWGIVTITTVGYGDVAPVTPLGKAVAGLVMLIGYAIIAVPTGIITAELSFKKLEKIGTQQCPHCMKGDQDTDATYCKYCGGILNP